MLYKYSIKTTFVCTISISKRAESFDGREFSRSLMWSTLITTTLIRLGLRRERKGGFFHNRLNSKTKNERLSHISQKSLKVHSWFCGKCSVSTPQRHRNHNSGTFAFRLLLFSILIGLLHLPHCILIADLSCYWGYFLLPWQLIFPTSETYCGPPSHFFSLFLAFISLILFLTYSYSFPFSSVFLLFFYFARLIVASWVISSDSFLQIP